jgi:flavin reductase (DIM6/NTAB) family NADH-FMN oxidoreductase RutF
VDSAAAADYLAAMAIDPQSYRDVMSNFASGVTVVTTLCEGVVHGLTVSAFSSVSLAPPRVLICLGNETDTKPLIERSGCFAVHILGSAHVALGPRFAKLLPDVAEPFAGLSYGQAVTGAPILEDCLAWLDCRVEDRFAAGDHMIFVGAVEAAAQSGVGEPLLYYRRAWRILADREL